ncbi:MAG: ribbon-helix-helix protein, CopG family [Actinomycetota bacterium]
MFSERLQILLTPQQRRHLQQEAKRRGTSVTALIREAISEHFGVVPEGDRERAYRSIVARRARYLAPDQLDELLEERFG